MDHELNILDRGSADHGSSNTDPCPDSLVIYSDYMLHSGDFFSSSLSKL